MWSKNFDEGPHRRGSFYGDNVMWHRPVWNIAVGCSSRAVMIPIVAYTVPMLFSGPDNPQNCTLPVGNLDPRLIQNGS